MVSLAVKESLEPCASRLITDTRDCYTNRTLSSRGVVTREAYLCETSELTYSFKVDRILTKAS